MTDKPKYKQVFEYNPTHEDADGYVDPITNLLHSKRKWDALFDVSDGPEPSKWWIIRYRLYSVFCDIREYIALKLAPWLENDR